MQLQLDELELVTIKAALDYFREAMDAFDEGRAPKFLPFQCVDENIGALTGEEIEQFLVRLENAGKTNSATWGAVVPR